MEEHVCEHLPTVTGKTDTATIRPAPPRHIKAYKIKMTNVDKMTVTSFFTINLGVMSQSYRV